ncbi:TLC domain-containing protein 2 isoform X2 [Gallus gallus]|uniref:TLC domain containing 2 n=1 Tax=Gallus gallus TaxID=9031 RepID=A0A8V1ALT0_CHICK|nr:TLC domain-containing protein 2 isoform X2 [Gallus gallus]XP_040543136.1 TLC domain-containing protein 2 isoform X2 [Gallus gallus]
MPGAVPVPGAGATGRGGAVGQRIPCPPWEAADAHGSGAGLAAGRRFFRRFPLVEPGGGAADAPAALGSAEPLEVAEHLDVAGTQRAERRRGAGGVSSRDRTARDRDGNVGPRGQRGRFCLYPGLHEDLVGTHPPGAHSLVAVSVGYFLEDFVDMLCNQKLHQSWELLFHHSVVIVCFGIAVLLHQYVGFALVALLVEINSIFLHLRQILLMADLVHTTCYRLNSIINLGTYVVFRIATLAWMTRWLFLNRQHVPLATYTVGTVGMAIMTPMNIILFYRLLRSDFFKSSRDTRREKEK